MKFSNLYFALLLTLLSCNSGVKNNPPESPTEVVVTPTEPTAPSTEVPQTPTEVSPNTPDTTGHEPSIPIGPEYPVKDVKKIFTVDLKLIKFDATTAVKANKASEVIAKVINSEEFKNEILNFTYNGKKQFVDNRGLSNEQIFNKLFEGAEALMPAVNYQMDLTAELYTSSTSTVGYTYANILKVYANYKYYKNYAPNDIAGNLTHEWMHKLGFDHASSYSKSRDSSVPYAVGYIVQRLGKKYL